MPGYYNTFLDTIYLITHQSAWLVNWIHLINFPLSTTPALFWKKIFLGDFKQELHKISSKTVLREIILKKLDTKFEVKYGHEEIIHAQISLSLQALT